MKEQRDYPVPVCNKNNPALEKKVQSVIEMCVWSHATRCVFVPTRELGKDAPAVTQLSAEMM